MPKCRRQFKKNSRSRNNKRRATQYCLAKSDTLPYVFRKAS